MERRENQGCRAVLPLVGSSYEPGKAEDVIQKIKDEELADIVRAEKFYFSAQARQCVHIVKKYLTNGDMMLRLSADMLYVFANLTIGDAKAAYSARQDVFQCWKKISKENRSDQEKAACIFAAYLTSILLHMPPEKEIPPLQEYLPLLPVGQRMFAISLLAHKLYLDGEYAKALGLVNATLILPDKMYPLSVIYLKCVEAMCLINLKKRDDAIESVKMAWTMAKKDDFLEPFIEYHGLLQGILEVCVRKSEPEQYKRIVDGVLAFSRGWMKLHNPQMGKSVTDVLTPMEFSIAMLACRDWTNKEIAEHMGMSVNTVKHYVSEILEKLQIDKRDKIKDFVNQ